MGEKQEPTAWSKIGMVIGGIMLTLMSGGSLLNSFFHDESAGYEAVSPLVQALIQDNARCAQDVAVLKNDMNWIKQGLMLEESPPLVEEPELAVFEALDELNARIERVEGGDKAKGEKHHKPARAHVKIEELMGEAGDPFELPDFDAVQKAY